MLKSIFSIFSIIWDFLKIPLLILSVIIAVFYILVLSHQIYFVCVKKIKKKQGEHYKVKQPNFFKRLFWLAPRRVALDYLERDPEYFKYQGIVIFEGKQGNGKTVSMIEYAMRMQQEYPKAVCLANLRYKYADQDLNSWDDLIDFKNPNGDKCGVIVLNDELQNTFNSKISKDFPMEYLAIVTQNRKNRRVLLGTAQNFYMLSKDIRSQCTELRKCFTLLGCITIVHVTEPVINSDGEVEKLKHKSFYFYVHSDELRNSYDTYEVVNKMRKSGFKPRSEQASSFKDLKEITLNSEKKGIFKK